MNQPDSPSTAYRFLTGLVGGLFIYIALGLLRLVLSPDGHPAVMVALVFGQLFALATPFRAAFFNDFTRKSAMDGIAALRAQQR
jgi:hypothetical protein